MLVLAIFNTICCKFPNIICTFIPINYVTLTCNQLAYLEKNVKQAETKNGEGIFCCGHRDSFHHQMHRFMKLKMLKRKIKISLFAPTCFGPTELSSAHVKPY
jgi:hypothetical protein